MLNYKLDLVAPGEISLGGYGGSLIDYVINAQLLDADTWALLVNQFRIHPDTDNGWRGEFFGKMMRGGCLTYRANKSRKLYLSLTNAVKDLLTTQEKDGRISSYPRELEFTGWDMWGRKYVLLGLLNYYEICESEALKRKVLKVAKKHADYIIKHVGDGRNKKDIFETSNIYGCLNSCSILEPFIKLYRNTCEEKYLNFGTYIVNKGFCSNANIIELALSKDAYPYELPVKKAYEMMSCFEGLLEYYLITGKEEHLTAVINFFDMIVESDYTIIGCSGTQTEFFDHSSVLQTEYKDDIMQETCVTVTFMNLAFKLLRITGNAKYADYIEKSSYNALYGAVNNENQTMKDTEGLVWIQDPPIKAKHEPFPFDSYSPLYNNHRGRRIGGFMMLQNGRSYGCCACIASSGTAVSSLFGVLKDKNTIYLNNFAPYKIKTLFNNQLVKISIKANLYTSNKAVIKIDSPIKFNLAIRNPGWSKGLRLVVNDKEVTELNIADNYIHIPVSDALTLIKITFKMPLISTVLNNRVAFTKGPIVYASDTRFGDVTRPLDMKIKNGKSVKYKKTINDKFVSNSTISINDGKFILVDYSQAGKNFDTPNADITVWHNQ